MGTKVNVTAASCVHCGEPNIWVLHKGEGATMVWPVATTAPAPHADMPAGPKRVFEEARLVLPHSPRAACALLRLSLETLAQEITGDETAQLFRQVGNILEATGDTKLQRVMDFVRITGNAQVHPGNIDDSDTGEIAGRLFDLVNLVVAYGISKPKEIDELYSGLSDGQLNGIARRDGD
jgi:hypothetical protein